MGKNVLVVDTSVIVKWLSNDREQYIDKANIILQDAQEGTIEIIAPELAKYETANVLLCGKHLSPMQAKIVLSSFYALPITFVAETAQIAHETFSFAKKWNTTYYDAAFLSLAKKYNAVLITEDNKHQKRAREVKVLSLREY